jgi:hypothetical protein
VLWGCLLDGLGRRSLSSTRAVRPAGVPYSLIAVTAPSSTAYSVSPIMNQPKLD